MLAFQNINNASLPVLIESNFETELALPVPLPYYWISTPFFDSDSLNDPIFILLSSSFEYSFYQHFSRITPILIENYDASKFKHLILQELNGRVIVSDISLFFKQNALSDFVTLMEEIEAQKNGLKPISFIIKSDLIWDSFLLAGIRRLFLTHLAFSKVDKDHVLLFLQHMYKGSVRSEKSILTIKTKSISSYSNVHMFKDDRLEGRAGLPASTFALDTNDEQKAKKAEVQLPYIKAQLNSLLQYVPDEADDIDEEDPDADLEF